LNTEKTKQVVTETNTTKQTTIHKITKNRTKTSILETCNTKPDNKPESPKQTLKSNPKPRNQTLKSPKQFSGDMQAKQQPKQKIKIWNKETFDNTENRKKNHPIMILDSSNDREIIFDEEEN